MCDNPVRAACVLVNSMKLSTWVLVLMPVWALAAPQQAPPAGPPAQQYRQFSPQQLETLVAPVALYPDDLLGQVLVASTYPLEIVEAGQWLQQNQNLQGPALVNAARQQNWDPSVQALVVFPEVLAKLNSDIHWTTDLGNAFLAQRADVMNAVQKMRVDAQTDGTLQSNGYQTVTGQSQGDQSAIDIQPANPAVVYVPEYNPDYVWGPPAYGDYPPLDYADDGFGWDPGVYIGGFFGGLLWNSWGWAPNWFGCNILLNGFFFHHFGFGGFGYGGGVWAHNPAHRLGVPYSNRTLATRFGGASSYGRGGYGGNASAGFNRSATAGFNRSATAGFNRGAGENWQHFGQGSTRGAGGGESSRFGSSAYRDGTGYNSYRPNSYYGGTYRGNYAGSYGSSARSYGYRSSYGGGYRAPSSSYRSYGGGGSFRGGGQSFHGSSGGGFHGGGGGGFHSSGGGGSHGGGRRR
jgi:hypothetical protein